MINAFTLYGSFSLEALNKFQHDNRQRGLQLPGNVSASYLSYKILHLEKLNTHSVQNIPSQCPDDEFMCK